MNYSELAKGVKHFKKEGGRDVMCEAVEAYAVRKAMRLTIEDAISFGIDKERILLRLCDKYGISREEAEEIYKSCLVVEV